MFLSAASLQHLKNIYKTGMRANTVRIKTTTYLIPSNETVIENIAFTVPKGITRPIKLIALIKKFQNSPVGISREKWVP